MSQAHDEIDRYDESDLSSISEDASLALLGDAAYGSQSLDLSAIPGSSGIQQSAPEKLITEAKLGSNSQLKELNLDTKDLYKDSKVLSDELKKGGSFSPTREENLREMKLQMMNKIAEMDKQDVEAHANMSPADRKKAKISQSEEKEYRKDGAPNSEEVSKKQMQGLTKEESIELRKGEEKPGKGGKDTSQGLSKEESIELRKGEEKPGKGGKDTSQGLSKEESTELRKGEEKPGKGGKDTSQGLSKEELMKQPKGGTEPYSGSEDRLGRKRNGEEVNSDSVSKPLSKATEYKTNNLDFKQKPGEKPIDDKNLAGEKLPKYGQEKLGKDDKILSGKEKLGKNQIEDKDLSGKEKPKQSQEKPGKIEKDNSEQLPKDKLMSKEQLLQSLRDRDAAIAEKINALSNRKPLSAENKKQVEALRGAAEGVAVPGATTPSRSNDYQYLDLPKVSPDDASSTTDTQADHSTQPAHNPWTHTRSA